MTHDQTIATLLGTAPSSTAEQYQAAKARRRLLRLLGRPARAARAHDRRATPPSPTGWPRSTAVPTSATTCTSWQRFRPGKFGRGTRSRPRITVLYLVRDDRRRRRLYVGRPERNAEDVLGEQLPAETPTPKVVAAFGEHLRIVSRCVERFEVARLKFVDNLPDREIAARQNLARDGVAGQLKRIRRGLRRASGDSE